jgi:hypothetical protein
MGQLISCDLIPRLTNPRFVWLTAQMGAGTIAVVLDPNVAALFTTSEAVNTLLGSESRRMEESGQVLQYDIAGLITQRSGWPTAQAF